MQKLGNYTFVFNPDRQGIPQQRKTVATVATYSSAAVFQWPALWAGATISLEWDWMSAAQYDALYALYLSPAAVIYDTDTGGDKYTVIVTEMSGQYFEVVHADLAWRKNVRMVLFVSGYTYDPPPPVP